MIIGNICKGVKRIVKRIIEWRREDMQDLAEVQNNLICRLTTASQEAGDNMIRAIKQIEKILD